MKSLIYAALLLLPGLCQADTFIMKDGAKLDGEVTGEMDGALLVKTKYGSLTLNKADIQEQTAVIPALAPAISAQVAAAFSTMTPVAVSTEPPVAAAQPQAAQQIKLTFANIIPSTSTRLTVYTENWVAIATETFDAAGALTGLEGAIKDGTYTEYYDTGALKTVKTMAGGKTSGTLKAYYPSGRVQIEAYYLAGAKDGPFKYFSEDGKPLMEAAYKNDKLNGWKKEFDAAGLATTETYYIDDHMAEPPKAQAAPEPEKEPESLVTVKTMALARGERYSFQLNGKYIGKAHLDKDFNIISLEGKIPDGAIKVYSKEGKLEKELVFKNNEIVMLRIYGPVEDSVSAIDFTVIADSKYDQLIKELSDAGASLKNRNIALIPFSNTDEKATSKNANIISERILTKLIKKGTFKVIERNLLDKVLKELNLQASGVIEPENARKLGGILGVEAIITGTIAEPSHGEIEVNARLINVETAMAIGASRILLDKSGASTKSGEYIFKDGQAVKKKL